MCLYYYSVRAERKRSVKVQEMQQTQAKTRQGKKRQREKAAKHSGPQKVAMHVSSMGGVGLWHHMFSQFAQAFAQEFAHHSFEEEGGVYLERRSSLERRRSFFPYCCCTAKSCDIGAWTKAGHSWIIAVVIFVFLSGLVRLLSFF